MPCLYMRMRRASARETVNLLVDYDTDILLTRHRHIRRQESAAGCATRTTSHGSARPFEHTCWSLIVAIFVADTTLPPDRERAHATPSNLELQTHVIGSLQSCYKHTIPKPTYIASSQTPPIEPPNSITPLRLSSTNTLVTPGLTSPRGGSGGRGTPRRGGAQGLG
jgi:hypothetical protein